MKDYEEARRIAQRLMQDKSGREARWRELSRWIYPSRGIFNGRYEDARRETLRFTQAAMQATLAGGSGLTSGMTPRNAAWFKPEFRQPELMELPGARQWLDGLDHLLKSCLATGGFYQAIHAFNLDLIWAGCALLFAEDTDGADEAALRYECPQIGTYAVSCDNHGQLNRVCRKLVYTAADMAETFGEEKLAPATREAADKNPLQRREVWHLTLAGSDGPHPVETYWWEEGNPNFLSTGGYREMPFFFTCWHPGVTVYGTGPGDEALPDARQMDVLERHKLEGLAKIINPPVAAPTHLKGHCSLLAGAINYVPDRSLISPILDLGSFATSLPHLRQEIQTVTQRLQNSLLASVFNSMPLNQRPAGMSATEFLERKREALQQLGPVISAYEPHVLTPLLFRTLQTLDYNGALPPPPDSLANLPLELTLDFISPMANALRQNSAETTRALFQEVAGILQASGDSSVLDKVNLDQMVDELATGLGAPGSIIRADAEVEQIRQQRAQAQAQQQQMQMNMLANQNAQAQAQATSAQAQAAIQMQAAQALEPQDDKPINLLG